MQPRLRRVNATIGLDAGAIVTLDKSDIPRRLLWQSSGGYFGDRPGDRPVVGPVIALRNRPERGVRDSGTGDA
jgi:hypothetical protein